MHSGRLLPLLSNTKRLWFSLRHSFKCTQHSLVADAPAEKPNVNQSSLSSSHRFYRDIKSIIFFMPFAKIEPQLNELMFFQ
ncbi:hypothetical protein BLOT_001225 [Blomia tropicalis]|nr:hypothetical protein BLOT_001225 [Blomia tropicalis]